MIGLRSVEHPERGVLFLDRNSRIQFANRRASEIFGRSIDELIGAELPPEIVSRPSSEEEVIDETLEDVFDTTAIFHRYSAPVYTENGAVAGRLEIYSDITRRRQLEEQILDRNVRLADLNKQLKEAQEQLIHSERLRTLGEMAAGVAHDINNVLGIIMGNAQLAKRKLTDNEGALECVKAIELAARDAAETVRRLREIGKPIDRAGYQIVDISNIARDVIRSAMPAWIESGSHITAKVSIETDFEDNCAVRGNASELREALANVLLNAAQAIEKQGTVTIATSRSDGSVELSVSDTGIGMNEETRQRLFDPFFTTRGAAGTGLGMSMVDAIVIRHGGRISVTSEEGIGTKVTMHFPAILQAENE